MDRLPEPSQEGLRDRDRPRTHGLGGHRTRHSPLCVVDHSEQRAVTARPRQAWFRADGSGGRWRDHLRAAPLELLADLVHVLRVGRSAFGFVARGGWTASALVCKTLRLFLRALVLEFVAFIHDRDTRTGRAIREPGSRQSYRKGIRAAPTTRRHSATRCSTLRA